ncbi:MAG: hypothetical protein OEW89_01145 [Gammaproteobacteria bacterium]|nr:hypothetical protein [Gammaproteobacteria bacterium]MDH5593705.1 hypothetical protein [Gammaproteobacteria bacterium]
MSSRQYAPPLRINLKPSRLLSTFIISTHTLTLGVLWLSPLQFAINSLLTLVLIISAFLSLKRHVFENHRIQEIIHDSDRDWQLIIGDSKEVYAELQANSYRHPFISILNFKTEDKERYSAILLPDNVDRESFRRLRVLLF